MFIRWKIYIDRARGYISYIQFFMLCLMFVKIFKIFSFVFEKPVLWFPILLVLFLGITIIVGWLDRKLGFFEAEQKRISEQNPILVEILKTLREKT